MVGDWLTSFEELTSEMGVPKVFTRWAGLHVLATAAGRRVWIENVRGKTYPNMYIMLVSLPGVGKSSLNETINNIYEDLGIETAPTHTSKAALVDTLSDNIELHRVGAVDTFHHCVIVSTEFAETFIGFDEHLLATLASWWDCPNSVKERKRHMKTEPYNLSKVCCNMLTGAQPVVMSGVFPEAAWSGGFLARTIMVYYPKKVDVMLRGGTLIKKGLDQSLRRRLIQHLETLRHNLQGEFKEHSSFIKEYERWVVGDRLPRPTHPKLIHYNVRREHQLEKLSMLCALSEGKMELTGQHYLRARRLLEEVESNVEDIFKEMSGSDDLAKIKELHAILLKRVDSSGLVQPTRGTLVNRIVVDFVGVQRKDSFLKAAVEAGYVKEHYSKAGVLTYTPIITNILEDET